MASIMGLHLQYRLWIAEMNADINVLRIFEDYLINTSTKNNRPDATKHINNFKEAFIRLRKEIDNLRDEMHLVKMKLAAFSKSLVAEIKNIEPAIDHKRLNEDYKTFRKNFDNIKKEFQNFENEE